MNDAGRPAYHEVVGNVHLHTRSSDGAGSHAEVAAAARRAGLDFVIPTDHNTLARQEEGWREGVLVLVGEETNDPAPPRASHYLAFGLGESVAGLAGDPQALLDAVRRQGGFGFIAHPCERPGLFIHEPAFNWLHWEATGYAGIELWNYMSEFKSLVTNLPATLWAAFFPQTVIRGPFPETLARYDQLLAAGGRVALIGGSDAHAQTYRAGPLRKVIFPYEALFKTVNLHLLLRRPLSGELSADREAVYEAMQRGRGFIGYHVLGDPRGFVFHAGAATYGDELAAGDLRFEIRSPRRARLRLLRDGAVVAQTVGTRLEYRSAAAGAYRAEAHRWAWLRWRGWVFTNPIYARG